MSEQEQPERLIAQLEPLESALRTYIGRAKDGQGPLYPQLELYSEREQLGVLPNVVRCLLSRTAETSPQYIGELAYEFSQTGLGSTDPEQKIADNSEQIGAEFVAFASTFYTDKIVRKATGIVSPSQKQLYIKSARDKYADNPLVKMAQEANILFRKDDLDNLGTNTVCAVTAVVEFLHHHRTERLKLTSTDPTSVA
jgi:hypothetical protein